MIELRLGRANPMSTKASDSDESSEAVLQRLVENCAAAPELSIVRRAEPSP